MQKRKFQEKFIDSILDHANSLQSLMVVKSNVDREISELSLKRKQLHSTLKKETTLRLQSFYLLRKRIEIMLPSFIDDATKLQLELLVPEHERTDIYRYRCMCAFKLTANELQHVKGYDLLVKYGYYNSINTIGVVKDHRLSIKAGFISKINPELLSHPANCEFLLHKDNLNKSSNSSITLDDLQKEIVDWNNRANQKTKRWKTFSN